LPPTRFATVVLAGRPNVGKSTLFNALLGTPLAVTSAKPQSTRRSVFGLRTDGDTQLLLVDPPGLLEPKHLLQEAMLAGALAAIRGADILLHLRRVADGPGWASRLPEPTDHPFPLAAATVLTCADTVPEARLPAVSPPTFLVSAVTGRGLDEVLTWCRSQAPEAPFRFDPDDLSTQPIRFFAAEFIHEAALEALHEELPYALAIEVDEFREDSAPVYIRATLYVERDSQRGMVIGAGGRTIKGIGSAARRRIEALLDARVFLDLHVKVLPGWRRSPALLRRFGFDPPTSRR
jgi:GTP-binding protein Era